MRWLWMSASLLTAAPALAGSESPEVASQYAVRVAGEVSDEAWWYTWDDAQLASMVDEALVANPDLGAAMARVQQADGAFWQSRSTLVPSLSFDVQTSHQPVNPGFFAPPGVDPDSTQNSMQLGLRSGWQVDLFGRNAMTARASRHDALAAEGDRDATALAIATRTGEAYYDLVVSNERLAVLQRQVQTARDLLDLVERRRDVGQAETVDVLQQRQQVAVLEASLPGVDAAVDLAAWRLGVLLGRATMSADAVEMAVMPELAEPPASGVPSDLLLNRPDLRAASKRSSSARARETAALLAFLPTLQLGGQLGWVVNWWGKEIPPLNEAWQISTQVSVPIFSGGQRHGALTSARGADLAAAEDLRAAILVAQQEAEGALLQDKAAVARVQAAQLSHDLARDTWERSRAQWLEGLSTYLTVFTNLGAYQRAELDLLDARRAAVSARIQLYDALGGTWTRDLGEGATR